MGGDRSGDVIASHDKAKTASLVFSQRAVDDEPPVVLHTAVVFDVELEQPAGELWVVGGHQR